MQKTIENQKQIIFYEDDGKGFPVLLIHGLAEDHTYWNGVKKHLASKFRIITPDLPGWGKSSLPENFKNIDEFADSIKTILDFEKITKCILIGHSMGGYVVLNFAKRFNDYLSGIGLFQSSALADDEEKQLNRLKVADFVMRIGVAPYINELYDGLFAKRFYIEEQTKLTALKNYAYGFSSQTIKASVMAMKDRPDSLSVLKNAKYPVLFVIGEEDNAAPPPKMFSQSCLPDLSVVYFIHEVGHMAHIENETEASTCIENFLEFVLNKNL